MVADAKAARVRVEGRQDVSLPTHTTHALEGYVPPIDPAARRVRRSTWDGVGSAEAVATPYGLGGGQTSILVVRDPLPTKWGEPRAGWSLGSTLMDAVPLSWSKTAPYTPFGGRHPS